LLRIFGSVLKQQTRITNFLCRTGGEEFAVILPETEKNEALQLAERLRISIEQHPFPYKETQPKGNLTISLGVASYVKGQIDLRSFIKVADDALYHAKRLGKNQDAILT
jgi:diguanylate cyclase (GGDEF)-like protein